MFPQVLEAEINMHFRYPTPFKSKEGAVLFASMISGTPLMNAESKLRTFGDFHQKQAEFLMKTSHPPWETAALWLVGGPEKTHHSAVCSSLRTLRERPCPYSQQTVLVRHHKLREPEQRAQLCDTAPQHTFTHVLWLGKARTWETHRNR